MPEGEALSSLRKDYQAMLAAGMFSASPPTFDQVLADMDAEQSRINAAVQAYRKAVAAAEGAESTTEAS